MMQLKIAQSPLPISLEPMPLKRPLRFVRPIFARQKRMLPQPFTLRPMLQH